MPSTDPRRVSTTEGDLQEQLAKAFIAAADDCRTMAERIRRGPGSHPDADVLLAHAIKVMAAFERHGVPAVWCVQFHMSAKPLADVRGG